MPMRWCFLHNVQEKDPDYKAMYVELYRAQLKAMDLLMEAHRKAEDIYLETGEPSESRET